MSSFNIDDLSENMNVFDRKSPRAVIVSKKTAVNKQIMPDYLCHSTWGTSSLGSDELVHFGIKGMKWGIRRFQYENGTLTPEEKVDGSR